MSNKKLLVNSEYVFTNLLYYNTLEIFHEPDFHKDVWMHVSMFKVYQLFEYLVSNVICFYKNYG